MDFQDSVAITNCIMIPMLIAMMLTADVDNNVDGNDDNLLT